VGAALPLLLWLLLALLALWRVALAWNVLSGPTEGFNGLARGLGSAVVHWRQLDGFVGPVALLLWLAGVAGGGSLAPTTLKQRRIGQLFTAWAGITIALALLNAAWDQLSPGGGAGTVGRILGPIADFGTVLLVIVAVLRELYILASEMPPGQVHLVPLWRFLTAQWLLAWVAATVFLRFTMSKEELLGNENARQLLFAIPAFGILPNTLMIAGIHLLNAKLRPTVAPSPPRPSAEITPRFRAWLLAVIAMTLGGILLVLPNQKLGLFGGPLLVISTGLYLAGFPRKAWEGTKPWLMAAWGAFALAMVIVTLERLLLLGNPTFSMAFIANAARHLLLSGATLWCFHAAMGGQEFFLGGRGATRLLTLAATLFAVGALLVTALFVATSFRQGEGQLPILRLLFWGILPEALGLLAVGLLLPRLRKSTSL
jgi:hypothetical protein